MSCCAVTTCIQLRTTAQVYGVMSPVASVKMHVLLSGHAVSFPQSEM